MLTHSIWVDGLLLCDAHSFLFRRTTQIDSYSYMLSFLSPGILFECSMLSHLSKGEIEMKWNLLETTFGPFCRFTCFEYWDWHLHHFGRISSVTLNFHHRLLFIGENTSLFQIAIKFYAKHMNSNVKRLFVMNWLICLVDFFWLIRNCADDWAF